jgi:geranyl-CoA carboxylase alpha subunit
MEVKPMPLRTLLIANRGEIALRILRSARAMGLRTVMVYSEADRGAPHAEAGDAAVCIGGSAPASAYLNIEAIVAAARSSGADAVHPGYGFLSENASFARACAAAGLTFVGPSAESIEAMGNKRQAKERMQRADVPCVPGFAASADTDAARWLREAQALGFPIMVKATAGGGGRGLRRVEHAADLPAALAAAASEARSAFGDPEVMLEKAVEGARHVEVQIFADGHGACIHLGERDCSAQRRHQKVLEESPSPAVDAALRERMGAAAVAAARAIGYRGAGTVEFLLAGDGAFYFMEMNTRLQVEHGVTELRTGLDLVAWQLRVARGEPLPLAQGDVRLRGHAMQARLCAEDPARDFLPQAGPVLRWQIPDGPHLRIDHALREGADITPFYDSMQAKILAWGENRDEARRRLVDALERTALLGVQTNRDLLLRILRHDAFIQGAIDTRFLDTHVALRAEPSDAEARAVACAVLLRADACRLAEATGLSSDLLHWHSAAADATPVRLERDGVRTAYRLRIAAGATYAIDEGKAVRHLTVHDPGAPWTTVTCDGRRMRVCVARRGDALWLATPDETWCFWDVTQAAGAAGGQPADGRVTAPMAGRVVALPARAGLAVRRGDTLLVIEAMKMELPVVAPLDGTVTQVTVQGGQQVAAREHVATVAPAR